MSESGIDRLMDADQDAEFIDPEIVLQQVLADPGLSQHITRSDHEGREVMTGYFRVVFEPGQQRQILHVPFSPPLSFVPQVQARATDLHDVRIRVTDRQKFGVRAEVILPRPTETHPRALIEIIASEPE